MIQEGCNKFFWGFLFILFNFRIQGVDILPDIIGYILFAMGFQALAGYSEHFAKGKIFNLVLVFLSVFTIYQQPNQGEETQINPIGIIMGVVTLVLLLVVVYRLLMGIKDMASSRNRSDIMKEARRNGAFFLSFK
ncbi:hypothetical protein [Paenibacillus sp. JCM 10914]|uniref:hypothetical protein n=1 Tax=Paenibacillus sp. JCM 10914 TaxID=1236974 RepID=UPI0003CC8919|nr:hypothetical protein [Paenibacillus sp. JCM 10914]GAE05899.1 hypothetical protein JCM10914_2031 [Paenibacillus sp. JCM 10914]